MSLNQCVLGHLSISFAPHYQATACHKHESLEVPVKVEVTSCPRIWFGAVEYTPLAATTRSAVCTLPFLKCNTASFAIVRSHSRVAYDLDWLS